MRNYIILMVLGFLFTAFSVVGHEMVHGQIDRYFGCEQSSYGVRWQGAYHRCADWGSDGFVGDNDLRSALHSLNEMVGYTFIPFSGVVVLFLGGIFLETGKRLV